MTASLSTFVVVNPAAGGGAARRRWPRIAAVLRESLGAFEHALTRQPCEATTLSRQALERGFGMIVAVGGDGTLNEVASGFFDGLRPVAPHAILGMIPSGTGQDFTRTFGIGTDLAHACARLVGGETRTIDMGHVRFLAAGTRRSRERIFLNVASFGVSADVAALVARSRARSWRQLTYLLATARVLLRYRDHAVRVAIDGGPAESLSVTSYAVCNGQYFGGGMWVAPAARTDDGQFDVTLWQGVGIADLLRRSRRLYTGDHVHAPGTRQSRASRIVAEASELVRLEVDGESVGTLPAEFEIVPAALRVKV